MSTQCSYNLRLTFILFLLLIILIQNYANAKQKLCGKVLTEVLATVCVNGFNYRIIRCLEREDVVPKIISTDGSWYRRLRSILQNMEDEPDIIEIDDSNSDENEIGKFAEASVIGTKGVADECCSNGCVYADIIMYCA